MSETLRQTKSLDVETKRFAIEDYLAILRYRKWLMVVPTVVLVLATAFGSLFLTDIYRAQTSILISAGDVPDDFVRTTVNDPIQERITTIREQILSETLLLNIVNSFGLYPEMANRPTEELIARIKGNIRLQIYGKNAFTISYTGTDPMVVQSVTNRLAQMFIEETVGDRQKKAKATMDFLAQQLEEVKVKLDGQEQVVAEFKKRNIGLLPEQMEANQRTLDRYQLELQSIDDQLRAYEGNKSLLVSQMVQLQGALMTAGGGQLVTAQQQLEALEAELKQALQDKTPEHPDVVALKSKIAALKAEIGTNVMVDGQQFRVTSVNRDLYNSIQQTEIKIRSLSGRRASVQSEMAKLNSDVSKAPAVEQELSGLMRDFDKLRETYQDLQKKYMEAKQATALEAQQKGRQFKIIDEARFPEKPYKPNRPRLVALAFVIGLMLGMVAIFITEHMDHSIRDDNDLAAFTGKTVLATIPRFEMEKDRIARSNMIKLAITAAAAIGFLILLFIILKVGFGFNPLRLIGR
ncbi:MAG TPA: GNVR domain-containing protein [bacterium]|nr:GNVR domain-containing protein [bacterium]